MSGNEKITVENMNLHYGKFHALKNINMAIPEKEITAFIGPSGCGKSTLLKSLNRSVRESDLRFILEKGLMPVPVLCSV